MNTNITTDITDIDKKHPILAEQDSNQVLEPAKIEPYKLVLLESQFTQLWGELTSSFENLLENLSKNRQNVDAEFKNHIEIAIQECRSDTGVPTIAEIEKRYESQNNYEIIYTNYLNKIRTQVLQNLSSLDDYLRRSLDQVKYQISEILIEKEIFPEIIAATGSEFLQALAMQIPDYITPGIPSQLKIAFQTLAEFELSYRGLLQYRIRPYLDGLTPNQPKTPKLTTSPSAEQILLNLKIAHIESLRQCENALKGLLSEPNQVAFAIVEEFVDRAIRATDIESEWQILCQDMRSQSENDSQRLGEKTQIQREWINSTAEITIEKSQTSELDSIFSLMDL